MCSLKHDFLLAQSFCAYISAQLLILLRFFCLVLKSWFRDPYWYKILCIKVITGFTDICSQVMVRFTALLTFVTEIKPRLILQKKKQDTQSWRSFTELISSSIKRCSKWLHKFHIYDWRLSIKNPTCCLIQTIYWLLLFWMSLHAWFFNVEQGIIQIKCLGTSHIIVGDRCV